MTMMRQLMFVVAAGAISGISLAAESQMAPGGNAPQTTPVCIAIVLPSVQGVEGSATEIGASVRELFTTFLTGPSLQAVALEARLASQAIEEARQKQCGHVLLVTLTRKRGGGGSGLFGKVVGQAGSSAAWGIPGGSVGSAVARGAAVAATQAVSELAASTKAKDDMRLDYKLTSVEGRIELGPRIEKAKAKTDGEDLLTPLVEKAAEAIVAVAKPESRRKEDVRP